MRVIGFHIMKGTMFYAILEGSKSSPSVIESNKINVPKLKNPEMMDWFLKNFEILINKHSPDLIAYRLTLKPNKNQIFYLTFPFGILNHICYAKSFPVQCFSSSEFTHKRLDLPKGTDIYNFVKQHYGGEFATGNKNLLNAILTALFCLS